MNGGYGIPPGVNVVVLDPWAWERRQRSTGGNQPTYMLECCSVVTTLDDLQCRDDLVEFVNCMLLLDGSLWPSSEASRYNGSLGGARLSAWRAKLGLHRAALNQSIPSDAGPAMSYLDQLLVEQIMQNVKVLRVHRWKAVMVQLIKTVLAFHLGQPVWNGLRLLDFALEGDESFRLSIEGIQYRKFSVVELLHGPAFQFHIQFADEERIFARERSNNLLLGPRDRQYRRSHYYSSDAPRLWTEQVVDLDFDQLMHMILVKDEWRTGWQNEAFEVAQACESVDPSSMILRTDMWRFVIKWRYLLRDNSCSACVASAEERLRVYLIQSLNKGIEHPYTQAILDILSLSVGCEMISTRGGPAGFSMGRLSHVSYQNDEVALLCYEPGRNRSVLLTVPLDQVPSLWQSGRYMLPVDQALDLPAGWLRTDRDVAIGSLAAF